MKNVKKNNVGLNLSSSIVVLLFTVCESSDDEFFSSKEEPDVKEEEEDDDVEVRFRASRKEERAIKDAYVNWWKDRKNNELYPSFDHGAEEGPASRMDPSEFDAFDYLKVLWGDEICELICTETNRYGTNKLNSSWTMTSPDEI